jgi:hypothetical protein
MKEKKKLTFTPFGPSTAKEILKNSSRTPSPLNN